LTAVVLLQGAVQAQAQSIIYDLPSRDLSKTLVALAIRSGRNIVFQPEAVAGHMSAPVHGALDFAEALRGVLGGTGLRAAIQRDGSVILSTPPPPTFERQGAQKGRDSGDQRHDAEATAPTLAAASVSAVVVTGRLGRAVSLTAADASIGRLSSAELERAGGATVLDALGALAGVTVLNGGHIATNSVPIDLAGRGEGNYASLRGLDAEFNSVAVNGAEAAQSQPYSRGVQLNLLPTAGLAQVVVAKTLTADMAGDVIGGVIDFRTPTAFDGQAAPRLTLSLGGQVADEAVRYGRAPFGGDAAIEASRVFGPAETFGVYVGGYYTVESFSNGVVDAIYPATTNAMFTYKVQTAQGAGAAGLNLPQNLVLTGLDLGLTTGATARFGGELSLDWRPGPRAAAYLRLSVAGLSTAQSTYYSQIYGNLISRAPIGTTGLYAPVIGYVQPRYYYETNPETSALDTLQVGAASSLGRWTLSGDLFGSWGETNDPDHFELSGREPEVAPGIAYGGSELFTDVGGVPRPLLSAADLSLVANIPGYGARRAGEITREFSHELKGGARIDARYRFASWGSLQIGTSLQSAARSHTNRDYLSGSLYTTDANDPSLASLGILSTPVQAAVPGVFNFALPTVNAGKALALFNSNIAQNFGALANAIDGCATLYVNNYNCDTQHGIDTTAAVYLMARLDWGDFELTPGFRYETRLIDNHFWFLPQPNTAEESPGSFTGDHTVYAEPLPSLALTYRPQAYTTYRASVSASYAPPAMYQLGGGIQIQTTGGGASAGGVTTITQGNPELKAVQSINIDLSGEWARVAGGQASAAVFYKALSHYIYDSTDAFSNATSIQTGDLVVSEPHNGGAGWVGGLELAGRQRLVALPAPWRGLGVSAALTLERSRVTTLAAGLSPKERLLNQPDLDTNAQVFFEHGGGGLYLSYRYTGPYVAQYGALGPASALDTWVRGAERLDLTGAFMPWGRLKVIAGVSNILNDISYHATIGEHSETIPSYVFSGRTYFLKTKWMY
jgi:TonB-dependent receptor